MMIETSDEQPSPGTHVPPQSPDSQLLEPPDNGVA